MTKPPPASVAHFVPLERVEKCIPAENPTGDYLLKFLDANGTQLTIRIRGLVVLELIERLSSAISRAPSPAE